jgi:hypothetical protein
LKRILIIAGAVFGTVVVAIAAGTTLFTYGLTRADPYPTFMRELAPRGPRSYEEAKQEFSQFVVRAFPVGSDAEYATKLIASGGFEVQGPPGLNSVHMLWSRHSGPCNERYSIIIDRTMEGKIAKATGQLNPACL